ncbi:MAG: hypothetical protein H6974_01910 [Gammaproteobacteria bacterium]|nr:hypothetical protein [Gammaproteobacteria bacterium]
MPHPCSMSVGAKRSEAQSISLLDTVEFHHTEKDHYFHTANSGDIAYLEKNPRSGWSK